MDSRLDFFSSCVSTGLQHVYVCACGCGTCIVLQPPAEHRLCSGDLKQSGATRSLASPLGSPTAKSDVITAPLPIKVAPRCKASISHSVDTHIVQQVTADDQWQLGPILWRALWLVGWCSLVTVVCYTNPLRPAEPAVKTLSHLNMSSAQPLITWGVSVSQTFISQPQPMKMRKNVDSKCLCKFSSLL